MQAAARLTERESSAGGGRRDVTQNVVVAAVADNGAVQSPTFVDCGSITGFLLVNWPFD